MIGALSRTLREEWRKSTVLATSIVYIFFCMSTFSQFHSIIVKQKVQESAFNRALLHSHLKTFFALLFTASNIRAFVGVNSDGG